MSATPADLLRARQPQYLWLLNSEIPQQLKAALSFYGLHEVEGAGSHPQIMAFKVALAPSVAAWYDDDDKAWCALFVTFCLRAAGLPYPVGFSAVRALDYRSYGVGQSFGCLGDVLVFGRDGGGHVGFYVGEDSDCFHVLGGNQRNEVNIMRIEKSRIAGIVRPPYRTTPICVRQIHLAPAGQISHNEG